MSTVSFVVLTQNEEQSIAARLWALRHQELRGSRVDEVQVLVIDNHSTDQTLLRAVPFVDGIAVAGPDREAQWDLGRRVATGDVVVRVDPDTEITPWMAAEAAERAHVERFAPLADCSPPRYR